MIHPHSCSVLDYDPEKDLAPITPLATFDVALVVGPQSTASSIAEFVAAIKSDPVQASYGSPGAGGLGHFVAVMFATTTKLDLRHVSYRGSAVANDLVAGQIPFAVLPLGDVTELHKAGKIRALASAGPQRSAFLPDVPTFKEASVDMVGQGWYGLYAPSSTPADVIARLNKVVVDAFATPEIKEKIFKLSLEPWTSTPAELATAQKADSARWAPVVKASGFKPEQ